MTPVELLEQAIAKLERLRAEVIESGKLSREVIVTCVVMLPEVARVLSVDLALFEQSEGDQLERVAKAAELSGNLALARAIIGEGQ